MRNPTVSIFLGILWSAAALFAQNEAKSMQMTGTICDSGCVTQVAHLATCDTSCNEKNGQAVFIDDQGNVKKIANQDICKSHMGKHVTMTAQSATISAPTEKEREQALQVKEIEDRPHQ